MAVNASTRRAALGAILAAPLASVPAVAAPQVGEVARHRTRLLVAYAEDRAACPVSSRAAFRSVEEKAAGLVRRRCSTIAFEIAGMQATPQNAGLLAIASAVLAEAALDVGDGRPDREAVAAVAAVRALLLVTRTSLPPGFGGFGDEPDFEERDAALFDGTGSLPAWAIAEAEGTLCA